MSKHQHKPGQHTHLSLSMSLFVLQSVKKDFGSKEIFRDANLSIEPNDKIGVIGTNGSGKSTLLRILAGIEPIDGGQLLTHTASNRIAYLPQQPEVDENKTVLEQVFANSDEQMRLIQEYEELSYQMAQYPDDEQLMAHFSKISQEMETQQAWDLETNAKIILSKLGIEDFDTPIRSLSGGYRRRIALATALLAGPDVLLMDEPTNHLDATSIEWLQNFLNSFRGALVLITHDRYFLDRVTNRIVEIDRGDLFAYDGNYSYYLDKKSQQEAATAKSQQKHQAILRKELEWLRRDPKARGTKQKARIQRIEEMQETEFKEEQGKVDISTPSRRIGKKVIELENIHKSFGDRCLIKDFSYALAPNDRIGIIGGNGAGKTTLLDIMAGRIEPDSGTVDIGGTIHIGYFDQHSQHLIDAANQNQRVIQYIKDVGEYITTKDGSLISASQMLERFLFPPAQQYTPLHKLSGGEKRRLFLLQVLMEAPNVLMLDEPTNDLDVQTLSVLEDYLENFNGCVIVVSHDRYFLDRTVGKIFALEDQGSIRQYPGNYSIYLDIKRAEAAEAAEKQKATAKKRDSLSWSKGQEKKSQKNKQKSINSQGQNKLSSKEKRELANLEKRIPELEAEKADLEKEMYNLPPEKVTQLQELYQQAEQLQAQIDEAMERWMALAEVEA